jgi:hypothetical protein
MKKHENLGKSLNRKEQKSISGGMRQTFNLYCNPGTGDIFISNHNSMTACTTAGAAECNTHQWQSCHCTGGGGSGELCL